MTLVFLDLGVFVSILYDSLHFSKEGFPFLASGRQVSIPGASKGRRRNCALLGIAKWADQLGAVIRLSYVLALVAFDLQIPHLPYSS